MAYCEDYPCCGHEAGGCPTLNSRGQLVYPCARCGASLPVNNPSAVCDSCQRDWQRDWQREDNCTDGCADCGDTDCDGTCADDSRMYHGEEMDGDADSALASEGHGMDEDYYPDTPLGDDYSGE